MEIISTNLYLIYLLGFLLINVIIIAIHIKNGTRYEENLIRNPGLDYEEMHPFKDFEIYQVKKYVFGKYKKTFYRVKINISKNLKGQGYADKTIDFHYIKPYKNG